jgi:hypothetical protein
VAQGIGSEFKPQYQKKKKRKERKEKENNWSRFPPKVDIELILHWEEKPPARRKHLRVQQTQVS